MALSLTEKDLENPEVLGEKLITLSEIIVRKHFYASVNEKDDLVSIGVLKALTMISEGYWSKSKGGFCTFLYTGMRNDMHNYLYHQNKFYFVEQDSLVEDGVDDLYFNDELVGIDYSLIHTVCMRFSGMFGDAIEGKVIKRLIDNGYNVEGMLDDNAFGHTFSCCNYILRDDYGESVEEDIIGRLIGLILWKKKESESALE